MSQVKQRLPGPRRGSQLGAAEGQRAQRSTCRSTARLSESEDPRTEDEAHGGSSAKRLEANNLKLAEAQQAQAG